MISKIDQVRKEFRDENYVGVLELLNDINETDEHYEMFLLFKYSSLMSLKRYDEALEVISFLIENNSDEIILWLDKARCNVFLNNYESVHEDLHEIEKLVDEDNVLHLVNILKLYYFLDDDENTLKYCDKVLSLDENNRDALFIKASVAIRTDDSEMLSDVSDNFVCEEKSVLGILPLFTLKIISEDFEGAYELVCEIEEEDVEKKAIGMYKYAIYTNLQKNLDIQLLLTREVDLSIDDVIKLFLKYQKDGAGNGMIKGAEYIIMQGL